MATAAGVGTWRELRASGQLGRFLVLCLGIWLHAADSLVTATTLPAIVADVGGIAYVAWTISLYQLGAIVAAAATALLCRRRGTERVVVGAALVYAAGCALAALAPTMAVLLAARLVQGLGGGALISLGYVAIQQWFPERFWGRLFGVQAVIWAAGSLLGPLLGGLFVALASWRGVFWCFGLQAALLSWLATTMKVRVPPERLPAVRFPARRLMLLAGATLLVAQAGVTGGTVSALALGLVGLSLLLVAARLDRRAADRLLPGQLLDLHHPLGTGLLAVFALALGVTGFWAYGPLLLQTLFGITPLVSGYLLAGEGLAWSAATFAVAALPPRAGRALIRVGTTIVAVGATGLAVAVPAGSLPGIVACLVLQGMGFGLCWPSIVQRIIHAATEQERSLAAAAPGTVQGIGYAVGAAATGIVANLSGLAAGISAPAAQAAAFWVFAAFVPVLVLGVLAAWRFTAERT